MKRIVAVAIGSYGDVEPFLVLGRELQRRGYHFGIMTFTDHKERIQACGLEYLPIQGDLTEMTHRLLSESKGAKHSMDQLKEMLERTPGLYENFYEALSQANLVIYMQFGALAYHFAEAFRIPCVRTFVYPFDVTRKYSSMFPKLKDGTLSCAMSYVASDIMMNYISCKTVNLFRKRLGLNRWHYLRSYKKMKGKAILTLYQYSEVLAPKDERWGKRVELTGPWLDDQSIEYEPTNELLGFLECGEKPVYVGFGSMVYRDMERLQEMLIAALKKQGMRAIFGSSGTKFKPTEDQTIYYADYIPFTWLFPRVKAVIHHGGCGTTHLGLRYGKPTFVIAFGGDQEFWGDRVWKLNVGPKPLCVNHNEVTVEALACGLEQLKKGVFEDKARMIGETLKRDKGVIAAADSIERIWKGRWNEY